MRRITPVRDILIDGKHCPAGVPVDAEPATAACLIASGCAIASPALAVETATSPAPAAAERAVGQAQRRRRT